jgi:hypothetical protein
MVEQPPPVNNTNGELFQSSPAFKIHLTNQPFIQILGDVDVIGDIVSRVRPDILISLKDTKNSLVSL